MNQSYPEICTIHPKATKSTPVHYCKKHYIFSNHKPTPWPLTSGQTNNEMRFLFQHFGCPINYQSTNVPNSLNQTLQDKHSFIFQYLLRPTFTVYLSAIPCAEYRHCTFYAHKNALKHSSFSSKQSNTTSLN
jgi:hypothetical protein